MIDRKRMAVNLVGSFVLPSLILAIGMVVSRSILHWGVSLDSESAGVGGAVGIAFLIRQFRAIGVVLSFF